jgi:hypothetical protein
MPSLERPAERPVHEIGTTRKVCPLAIAFSGISTVRLKWLESSGWIRSITSRRYALKALVVSL